VLEIFYLGITTGTTPTAYDPASGVSRLQMAAFLSRSVDGVLRRGGRRAALDQYWTLNSQNFGTTTLGAGPELVKSDGEDLWVANSTANTVSRVHASDGRLLETWTGAVSPFGILPALGRIFVTGQGSPGRLFRIDPSQAAGAATTVASTLGKSPSGIAFDGTRIWTANNLTTIVGAAVSIITPAATIPWTVTSVPADGGSFLGILYDGANIWATDHSQGTLVKLDSAGAVLSTITVGAEPQHPVFDGTSIWVPNRVSASVTVVRASTGVVLATLTGNGLNQPIAAAFDGQRILVTDAGGGTSPAVSLWKAADLTTIGTFPMGSPAAGVPTGACSDGVHFWITLNGTSPALARF
ncbi:MAG TPA: hypothetical protein VGQ32_01430, partial [Thermoanaerobaculia bacterium]|nr:hypothetical protein [Thermoanaerobaculia bacterium]